MIRILITLLLFTVIGVQLQSQSQIDYPIYFAYKVAEMDTTEQKRMTFFLKNFDSFTIDSIAIRGYCDDRGRKKINDTLSLKRAEHIALFIQSKVNYKIGNYILGEGSIPIEGKKQALDSIRALNRRAELTLFYSMKIPKNAKPNPTIKKKIDTIPAKLNLDSLPAIQKFLLSAKAGEKIDLKIYFEGGSSIITKASAPEMVSLLNIMKANDKRKIKITGHIYQSLDKAEKDAYDSAIKDHHLSRNRAKKVYTFLVNNGIDAARITYEGQAARYPRGGSPEEDRRVEIEVVE